MTTDMAGRSCKYNVQLSIKFTTPPGDMSDWHKICQEVQFMEIFFKYFFNGAEVPKSCKM